MNRYVFVLSRLKSSTIFHDALKTTKIESRDKITCHYVAKKKKGRSRSSQKPHLLTRTQIQRLLPKIPQRSRNPPIPIPPPRPIPVDPLPTQ